MKFQELRRARMTTTEIELDAGLKSAITAADFDGIQTAHERGADIIAVALGSRGTFVRLDPSQVYTKHRTQRGKASC